MLKLLHRYGLAAVPFLVLIVGIFWSLAVTSTHKSTQASPPTKVIMQQATITDQGIQLSWLPAQAGGHPISGYVIERKHTSGYKTAGRVEASSLSYIDNDGRVGDIYRIIAEDTQQPAMRSASSETLAATRTEPGSSVKVAAAAPSQVLGFTTPSNEPSVLQQNLSLGFTTFDTLLTNHDLQASRTTLTALQKNQQHILAILPNLPADQKAAFAAICTSNAAIFDANLHLLPEADQMDGMIVVAGCNAIQAGAQ